MEQYRLESDNIIVHSILAKGAFGTVHTGVDTLTNEDVVIKYLSDQEMASYEIKVLQSINQFPEIK